MEWLEVANYSQWYAAGAAAFSALRPTVRLKAAAVWLGAFIRSASAVCVCTVYTLNVKSFRGLYCVYVTACARFCGLIILANDVVKKVKGYIARISCSGSQSGVLLPPWVL